MSASIDALNAHATAVPSGDALEVVLGGTWLITGERPSWAEVRAKAEPKRVRVRTDEVERWDTSLLLFLFEIQEWCRATGAACDVSGVSPRVRALLDEFARSHQVSQPVDRGNSFLTSVGLATVDTWTKVREFTRFVGDFVLSVAAFARSPHRFRWRDCINEMQQCGAMALPIVSLISFLVGVTLAYTGAIVLRQYGGDIFIADLIGLSMVREMGAVMTAVVLAGRTGAAYAATLGNMKANEEIDALETLGISAVHFLVLPRMLALMLMMPLLTLYANALGILGGMAVALGLLSISPTAYWVEMLTIVDLSDLVTGLIKAVAFAFIIGLCGCLRGLQAERSAAGVGHAATSAVVTSLLLLVVADAIFAVVFNILGW